MVPDEGFRLFVYGTLLRGECNYSPLMDKACFLRETSTESGYRLVDLGDYPGMVTGGRGVVVGELFQVDRTTLEAIDHLEGHPHYYQRTVLQLTDGSEAWAYLLPEREADTYPMIEGGDWRLFRRGG